MASPTRYDVSYSFDDFQTANPTTPLPADKLEIELSNIVLTTDQIIDNLSLIQRSDGALANAIVSFDTLTNDMKTLLGSPINPRGAWVTSTSYEVLDLITQSGSSYLAVSNHTSGVFATDLAANKWILWAASNNITINNSNWSGTDLTVNNGGTGVSTLTGIVKGNGTSAFTAAVQGTDYYAPSGTDVAVADGGTGASTAANARTNLGLGALATLSSVNNDNWSGNDLSVGNGGTGASDVAGARTNLDVYSKGETDVLLDTHIKPFLHLQDQKTSGTESGSFTSGAWRTRTLNTEVVDTIGSTLTSDQFVLPAGTYYFESSAPAFSVGKHLSRLQNITDATTTLSGTSEVTASSISVVTKSQINGMFTISGAKTFELQHQCQTTNATNGFGGATGFGTEVYAEVRVWKVA